MAIGPRCASKEDVMRNIKAGHFGLVMMRASEHAKTLAKLTKEIASLSDAVADDALVALKGEQCSRERLFSIGVAAGYLRGMADTLGIDVAHFVEAFERPDEAMETSRVIARASEIVNVLHPGGVWGKRK